MCTCHLTVCACACVSVPVPVHVLVCVCVFRNHSCCSCCCWGYRPRPALALKSTGWQRFVECHFFWMGSMWFGAVRFGSVQYGSGSVSGWLGLSLYDFCCCDPQLPQPHKHTHTHTAVHPCACVYVRANTSHGRRQAGIEWVRGRYRKTGTSFSIYTTPGFGLYFFV